MSGGAGSRLWPLSRRAMPKQLLPLVTDKTMVQETVARFDDPLFGDPVFICNQMHVEPIQQQMSDIGCAVGAIIVEPVGRNTAPCAVVAACHGLDAGGAVQSDDLIMLVPADHHVKNPAAFLDAIKKAAATARQGYLVTFGITPDRAETGYGYIAQGEALADGVYKAASFREKPDAQTAQSYLDDGGYAWNAGIFLFSPDSFLKEVHTYADEIHNMAQKAYAQSSQGGAVIHLNEEIFSQCPSESIDYAVMEHTQKAAIVPCDIGWNDIGSYASLLAARVETDADEKGNAVRGSVIIEDSQNCLVDTDSLSVSLVGVKDLSVIVRDGEVLIVSLDKAQSVKKIVETLKAADDKERL